MSNSLIVETAPPLAPPSEHAAQTEPADDIVDLDAGDSLLDGKPDDGQDTSGDEPSPGKEIKEPDPEKPEQEEGEEEAEDGDDATIAALTGETPKQAKPSGSARLKAKVAELQAEVERLQRAAPKADDAGAIASAVESEIGPPPKESDFSDYLAFQKAETAYEVMKGMVSRELRKNAEAAKQAHQAQQNAIVETFRERSNEVRKLVKDFDAVVNAATVSPSNQDVAMAILESDKGPHIAYYLSKHPEKVHEINAMPLRRALAEVGRLEARLTPAPRRETKAPAPVPAVKGGTNSQPKDPEKMSMDEFAKWFDQKKSSRG